VAALDDANSGPVARAVAASLIAPAAPDAASRLAEQAVARAGVATPVPEDDLPFRGPFGESPWAGRAGERVRPGWTAAAAAPPVADSAVVDSQRRRVAAALAVMHPALAQRAAAGIRRAEDRSGSYVELAAQLEARDPVHAAALYRLALQAAEQIRRPMAARRAARIRAAAGLAAFDSGSARAVMEEFSPRLVVLQLGEFAVRLARSDPEASLRLIQHGEAAMLNPDYATATPFSTARAAVAEQIARRNPRLAAEILAPAPGRRGIDGWLALARGMSGAAD
jgi:hypothetical protein